MKMWIEGIARADGIEAAQRTASNPTGGASLHALGARVLRLVKALRVRHKRHSAIRVLSSLSDHNLRDIGVDRSEIRSVVEDMIRSTAAARAGAPASPQPIRRPSLAGPFLGGRPCGKPC